MEMALQPATQPAEQVALDEIAFRNMALGALCERARAAKRASRELTEAVVEARRNRATWEEIGSMIGLSRQAAWDRYAKHVPPGVD